MSAITIVTMVIGIAAIVLGALAVLRAIVRYNARMLAAPLLGRSCPHCGGALDATAMLSAREEGGFDLRSRFVSVVCPGCSKRWKFASDKFNEPPHEAPL